MNKMYINQGTYYILHEKDDDDQDHVDDGDNNNNKKISELIKQVYVCYIYLCIKNVLDLE